MCRLFPNNLERDKHRDAGTRFRKLHSVEVSWEISRYEVVE
jgi:hypothetical protein